MAIRLVVLRHGARLGVDPGDVRIGVAVSDADGLLATPVESVPAGAGALERLATLAADHRVVEVVLGLPRSLSGQEGPAAVKIREFGGRLAALVAPLPVRLVDERLSTVSAQRSLRDGSLGAGRRSGAKRRAVVDQAAAVVILQTALDTERASGTAPGEIVAGEATPAAAPDAPRRDREVR